MKRTCLLIISAFAFRCVLIAQITSIPDVKFEQALVDMGIDSDGIVNGQILTSDAIGISRLDLDSLGIFDLTGIEVFSDLNYLNVNYNFLSSLDLSQNNLIDTVYCNNNNIGPFFECSTLSNLTVLDINDNDLYQLDLTGLSNLRYLNCSQNKMHTLTFLNNPVLDTVIAFHNNLVTVDLSALNNLRLAFFLACGLNSVDLTGCDSLKSLILDLNNIDELDLSGCPELLFLAVYGNELTELDFTPVPKLWQLQIGLCPIQHLDLSVLTELKELHISKMNSLQTVDIKSGSNANLQNMWVTNCPNIECIQVDSIEFAYSYIGWQVSDSSLYSEDCQFGANINELENTDWQIYPTVTESKINVIAPVSSNYAIATLTGKIIVDGMLTSDFTELNVDFLSAGMYLFILKKESYTEVFRLIKV